MRPREVLYTSEHVASVDYERDLGDPGEFPYTRGLHPAGYRSKVWTMRQFAGFGTPEQTNERYRQLLGAGGTGLSVAFDLPTLMGRDPDEEVSRGEVGKCGVSVSSLADMEALFQGVDLGAITTSMTINAPAPMLLAMYLVVAEQQGADWAALSGTIQNDILKEFIAQKEFIYPPDPSMRLVIDVFAFCSRHLPRWNSISVSGYHIREAGATAAQELGFTLRNGIEYLEHALRSGLDVDEVAPRMSFFFNSHSDFFEELAKFRAARRLWARTARERFKARNPRSWQLRCHAQTAGVSLTAQQPYNNVVRTALQALAAVLGGVQSLHTNALDEALALPTEAAATLALRTQQILAHETGLVDVVDPFGGSYYLERLTSDLEHEAASYIEAIDDMGGMIAAIERGFPQREIADSAYRFQRAIERREQLLVGVNECVAEDRTEIGTLYVDEDVGRRQCERLERVRARRDGGRVRSVLGQLEERARTGGSLMPLFIEGARAYATVGEMCGALRAVWGEWVEAPVM